MQEFTDYKELKKTINKERKENKNVWVFFNAVFCGELIQMKFYNNWIQQIRYRGLCDGSAMGLNVKGFNDYLERVITG